MRSRDFASACRVRFDLIDGMGVHNRLNPLRDGCRVPNDAIGIMRAIIIPFLKWSNLTTFNSEAGLLYLKFNPQIVMKPSRSHEANGESHQPEKQNRVESQRRRRN